MPWPRFDPWPPSWSGLGAVCPPWRREDVARGRSNGAPAGLLHDVASIDRLHFYIPGWETPKMETRFFTSHYGFVVHYMAEVCRELRKRNYADLLDRYWEFGDHLNARDVKAVRKTVSGLVKLLHPAGDPSREELEEYLELAMEGRRRVKEQLRKMGAFEYSRTSFSYIDRESREQRFVGVPEEGGGI
ncbi:MAG: hypothetical protein C4344_03015 [Acidimicrobiia bacterium]